MAAPKRVDDKTQRPTPEEAPPTIGVRMVG